MKWLPTKEEQSQEIRFLQGLNIWVDKWNCQDSDDSVCLYGLCFPSPQPCHQQIQSLFTEYSLQANWSRRDGVGYVDRCIYYMPRLLASAQSRWEQSVLWSEMHFKHKKPADGIAHRRLPVEPVEKDTKLLASSLWMWQASLKLGANLSSVFLPKLASPSCFSLSLCLYKTMEKGGGGSRERGCWLVPKSTPRCLLSCFPNLFKSYKTWLLIKVGYQRSWFHVQLPLNWSKSLGKAVTQFNHHLRAHITWLLSGTG